MIDLQVIRNIIAKLDTINVPVVLTKQIAVPIGEASGALKAFHDALVEALKKKEKEEQGDGC